MHTLKGTSALLGATELSNLARELEVLCKSPTDSVDIVHMADQLDHTLELTTFALTQVIQELSQELVISDQDPVPAQNRGTLMSAPSSRQVLALRNQLQELDKLLVSSDLAALEKFADIRCDLELLDDAYVRALEDALQSLKLDSAHRVCLDIFTNLPEVHDGDHTN
jgi:HPt (histidine-containing phosphotransfer) domain-containing protein